MSTETASMDPTPASAPSPAATQESPWGLWRRQLAGILRLELRKNIFSTRAVLLYLLAALPVGLWGLLAAVVTVQGAPNDVSPATIFSVFYGPFLGLLFFACLIIFLQLFRGDVMDQSLHYYFLCPVRRELLVAAKYLAGVVSTAAVLCVSLSFCYMLIHYIFGAAGTPPNVVGTLIQYLGITVLAVFGYGAFFMLSGLYFRNPVVPPFALFLWELIHHFLPAVLKKFSVLYYIEILLPIPVDAGPLAILADPISPVWAVLGLLGLSALAVWLSAWRIKRMEISYTDDD